MSLRKKTQRMTVTDQKKTSYSMRRLEKLKKKKEHYLRLLKQKKLPKQSYDLVYNHLQKIIKTITIIESRK